MAQDGRQYLDPKTLEKITRLDLRARLVVQGYITGLHKSPYHGIAVEFASHREYVPGDEIKHIDWKVWGRQDRLTIKEYEEETNLKCTILLDASKSMAYGQKEEGEKKEERGEKRETSQGGWLSWLRGATKVAAPATPAMGKFEYAATTAACLAYLLQQQSDAVGLVTFDTQVRRNLPASSHPSHLKLLLHELEQSKPDNKSDVGEVFHGLAEQISKRGLVVLISDLFVDLPTLVESLRHFRHRRHEVVVFHVLHDHELTFPFDDNTLFRGLEVPVELLTEPRALRRSYLEVLNGFLTRVRKACADCGIDYVPLNTKEPLDAALSGYLAFRQRTMRKVRRK